MSHITLEQDCAKLTASAVAGLSPNQATAIASCIRMAYWSAACHVLDTLTKDPQTFIKFVKEIETESLKESKTLKLKHHEN